MDVEQVLSYIFNHGNCPNESTENLSRMIGGKTRRVKKKETRYGPVTNHYPLPMTHILSEGFILDN